MHLKGWTWVCRVFVQLPFVDLQGVVFALGTVEVFVQHQRLDWKVFRDYCQVGRKVDHSQGEGCELRGSIPEVTKDLEAWKRKYLNGIDRICGCY